jgi:hypothetical protein
MLRWRQSKKRGLISKTSKVAWGGNRSSSARVIAPVPAPNSSATRVLASVSGSSIAEARYLELGEIAATVEKLISASDTNVLRLIVVCRRKKSRYPYQNSRSETTTETPLQASRDDVKPSALSDIRAQQPENVLKWPAYSSRPFLPYMETAHRSRETVAKNSYGRLKRNRVAGLLFFFESTHANEISLVASYKQEGSEQVLHRPIETARLLGMWRDHKTR